MVEQGNKTWRPPVVNRRQLPREKQPSRPSGSANDQAHLTAEHQCRAFQSPIQGKPRLEVQSISEFQPTRSSSSESLVVPPTQLCYTKFESTTQKQIHAPLSSVQTLPHHRLPEGNNEPQLGFETQIVEVRPQANRHWLDDQQLGDTSRGHQR